MRELVLGVVLAMTALCQSKDGKVRVFVADSETWESSSFNMAAASGSANNSSARSEGHALGMSSSRMRKLTIDVMSDLTKYCPTVVVVSRQDIADYFLRLDFETGFLAAHSKMAVFNRGGRWCLFQ